MKNGFYLFTFFSLISCRISAMEKIWDYGTSGTGRPQTTMSVAMYFQLLAIIDGPEKSNATHIEEYPHQPKQQFRVKKTHQPQTNSRRQFTQHHK